MSTNTKWAPTGQTNMASREDIAAQLIAEQVARQQLAADQAEYELQQVALVCRHGKLRSQCGLHR
jgi:hypothetical protein